MEVRLTRRLLGLLKARLPDAGFQHVPDRRRCASVRWSMPTILTAVVATMAAGHHGLRAMEALTAEMSRAGRRLLGIARRLPDTTARTALLGLEPSDLRDALRRQVRQAHRRKALRPDDLPFGVVALDGKFAPAPPLWKSPWVLIRGRHTDREHGLIGTLTAMLISSRAKVVLDAAPIPRSWGEESRYPFVLDELVQAYGSLGLFQLVTYDAGACSQTNARATRELGLDYLFRLKDGRQPKLTAQTRQRLGDRALDQAVAIHEEQYRGSISRRSVYLSEAPAVWPCWTGACTVLRIRCDRLDDTGAVLDTDDRYYVTSLAPDALTGEQWIRVTRGHWAVENNGHHTLDAVMREDDRPWIVTEPKTTLVVMLLRRVAYNLLALYRSVTRRGDTLVPWRDLLRWIHTALIVATPRHIQGLRARARPNLVTT